VTANKHNSNLVVQVFWKHRNDYEWRLRDENGEVIAKGRANNYAEAKRQGTKKGQRVSGK
jgi:hypothetical protein